jgi:hypothetical protein
MAGTPDPRVAWLVTFSEMKLPPVRPRGWGAVREALATFCVPAEQPVGRGVVVGLAQTGEPAPEAEIRALQEDVRRLLAGLVDPSAVRDGSLPVATVNLSSATVPGLGRRSMLLVSAPTWHATALGTAAIVVSRAAVPPVQRCQDPDCHEGPNGTRALFARRGKQHFCSPRCATRVYMRAYREKSRPRPAQRSKRPPHRMKPGRRR